MALSNARQPKLSNIYSFINSNIRKALLLTESEKKDNLKAYRISNDGVNYVENYVPNENSKSRTSVKQKKSKKIESDYLKVSREELNLDKYPSIKEFSKFKDKMILVIYIFSQEGKGTYFTVNDILTIMPDIFGESATRNQIHGVLRRNLTWFNRKTDGNNHKYKLLNGAIEHAKSLLSS